MNEEGASPKESQSIDWARLDDLSEDGSGSGELLTTLVGLFEKTTRASLDSLRSHLEAGDRGPIPALLHRMKGGCATMGARGLAALTAEMEEVSETDSLESLVERHSRLEGEFRGAMLLLKESRSGR